MRWTALLALTAALACAGVARLAAQVPPDAPSIYAEWCARCHGEDGRGKPQGRPVETVPKDFTDCRLASGEADEDWALVIERGGFVAGHSSEMPPFAVLSKAEIADLVKLLRGFCRDARWPSGNLNMSRAMFTQKAFPENEVVLQPTVSLGSETFSRMRMQLSYERRVGRRAGIEIGLPAESISTRDGHTSGIGDVELAAKYVLYASHARPLIVTGGVDVTLATGSRRWGFGEGTTVAEPFVAAATTWHGLQLQSHVAAIVPRVHFPTEPIRYVIYNAAVSRRLTRIPHRWTGGLEVNGVDGAVGLTPFIARDLTKRGGVSAAFGVQLPVRPPYPYTSDVIRWTGYLLWDYMEPLRTR